MKNMQPSPSISIDRQGAKPANSKALLPVTRAAERAPLAASLPAPS